MKTRTIKTMYAVAYISALAAFTFTAPADAAKEEPSIYPKAMAVIDVSGDRVTARTCGGLEYVFRAEDTDLMPGDLIACIMDDNGTPETVLDDAITEFRYSGYGDPAEW